ncbi:hypothetical protein PEM_06400 [Stenotrophomonas sp. Pemsol]|nr:hypothetical protein PEM_06400 [Stenotrophomonas sp. Pemsol]PZT18733.1 hypothetical protein A7X86_11160 [Stenotrophomonas maltophilia]
MYCVGRCLYGVSDTPIHTPGFARLVALLDAVLDSGIDLRFDPPNGATQVDRFQDVPAEMRKYRVDFAMPTRAKTSARRRRRVG